MLYIINTILDSAYFWAILRIILLMIVALGCIPLLIYWERKLLSWMQDRIGPNRVGPKGLFQPIADGIKLFFKEEVRPSGVDRFVFWLAPALTLLPAFTAAATIPWNITEPIRVGVASSFLTPVANVNIGVLWLLAITSVGVYGVVLAGWSSNNKYSLLGGLRSSAQLISYELSMGLALGSIILVSGSLQMPKIIQAQTGALWGIDQLHLVRNWFVFTPFGFIAFLVFLVCMIAETNRAPFDLPEAENELVAGFHTEYSSMKFAAFYMGEYANMLTLAALAIVMFVGGYTFPINLTLLGDMAGQHGLGFLRTPLHFLDGPWLAPVWFLSKVFAIFTFYIWLRATLPRLRYDQLMDLGWKGLLPTTIMLLFLNMVWLTFGWQVAVIPSVVLLLIYFGVTANLGRQDKAIKSKVTLHKQSEPM